MKPSKFFAALESARRGGRQTGRFNETVAMRPGVDIRCQSVEEHEHWSQFRDALLEGHIKPDEISLKNLFIETVRDEHGDKSYSIIESWNPMNGGHGGFNLLEAGDAISTADFANITGQIVYTALLDPMPGEDFPFTALIPTQQTPFDGEKIAGVTSLGDEGEVVAENENYPTVGVAEDWIQTPITVKRGLIVPVTKEAVFFDRTNQVLTRAREVGQAMRIGREKRAIDCIIDENRTQHRLNWRGTSYATYQASSPWDNVTASAALVDWTDIDAANQTLNGITDPHTGEPVVVEADTLICTKQLEETANRIRNATEITVTTPGYATSGNPTETRLPNPMGASFEVVSTRLLAARAATDTTWLYGNPRAAFQYMENWAMTVVEAPANNSDEFHRDIVFQAKASERGEYTTLNPRFMTECTA